MALWEDVYSSNAPLIALTDTFSSDAFFRVLGIFLLCALCSDHL